MKVTAYMRVARSRSSHKPKVVASSKPNYAPLTSGTGYNERPVPTAHFAIEFDVPDEALRHAEQILATLDVTDARPAVEATEK